MPLGLAIVWRERHVYIFTICDNPRQEKKNSKKEKKYYVKYSTVHVQWREMEK